jgi:hypothetical protein
MMAAMTFMVPVGSLVILALSLMMVAMPIVLGMVSVVITVSRMFSVSIIILFFHNISLIFLYETRRDRF